MNNTLLQFKIKERLNKLDSKDYANLDCFKITEAFNKFQLDWARRIASTGGNTKQNVEDIQPILKDGELSGTNRDHYFETLDLPKDFLSLASLEVLAERDGCKDSITVDLLEQGNTEFFLNENTTEPSFEWRQSFYTMNSNKLRIYTSDFNILSCKFVYYRKPHPIAIEGCEDEFGAPISDTQCEFKDDVVEMLIQGTCSILAGDMENFPQAQRLQP